MSNTKFFDPGLDAKPDFLMAIKRIYAWYENEIIDRAPVRFTSHNAFVKGKHEKPVYKSYKEEWFDAEFQLKQFTDSLEGKSFLGETFPVYWPNLGPGVYASFYGSKLEFEKETSWTYPCIDDWGMLDDLRLETKSEYYLKLEELTDCALDICKGRFLVGYTDLHPGMDCVAAWRDPEVLCLDLYDAPDMVMKAINKSEIDFLRIYDHFDSKLKRKGQLSVTWMEIPFFERMHIPSCDFASMISKEHFNQFCLPAIQREMKTMTHNIFHLDGKGVARHIDAILELPQIGAIQWVQGPGKDKDIMQWVPLIKKMLSKNKSVVIDLELCELESFMDEVPAGGVMLCVPAADEETQKEVIRRISRWK